MLNFNAQVWFWLHFLLYLMYTDTKMMMKQHFIVQSAQNSK